MKKIIKFAVCMLIALIFFNKELQVKAMGQTPNWRDHIENMKKAEKNRSSEEIDNNDYSNLFEKNSLNELNTEEIDLLIHYINNKNLIPKNLSKFKLEFIKDLLSITKVIVENKIQDHTLNSIDNLNQLCFILTEFLKLKTSD